MQNVTWDTGDVFVGVENIIQEKNLPCLFLGKTKTLSPIVGVLSTMLINMVVLGLLNPVTSAKANYLSSQSGSAELIWYVTGLGAFSNADHL